MNKTPNKYIAVSYRLYVDGNNGKELMEEATAEQPFHFISGFGIALDSFEKQLVDLEKDATFDFALPKEEAYGDYEEAHVIDLDREIFSINGHFDHEHIYVDAVIPLQNEDGNHFYGRVVEVGEEKVKVDLNHPLAGETLYFEGKVLENREATNEEIQGMIARMSGGCGCGCHHDHGDCDGNCDGDCSHKHGDDCGCGHCH
ncbi:MAG: FKBP-type peptidyl-prolyl cis-trans isomerase [Prevotella sp.]|nr:FKBP-type peptidyl-prolyl cis-trans isomerase [Prevotella sp.]